ncbi:hypothetical protein ACLFKT_22690, partial [Paraburkholderia sp. BR14261]
VNPGITGTSRPESTSKSRLQYWLSMDAAMSELLDEYPMLMFGLEALLALFLLIFIVVWTASGRKKQASRDDRRQN